MGDSPYLFVSIVAKPVLLTVSVVYDRRGGAEAKKGEEKELNVTMIASTCVLDPISGHGRYPFFMLY